jgi:hypothetical protein
MTMSFAPAYHLVAEYVSTTSPVLLMLEGVLAMALVVQTIGLSRQRAACVERATEPVTSDRKWI